MRIVRSAVLILGLALVPTASSAVTVEQIVALSKAGVSEPIILALIDRDKTIFTIEPEQLVSLRRQGISEAVILAMLKSGRAEGEAAADAAAAFNAAVIMSTLPVAPEVVIVGHGPQRPNTGHLNGFWTAPVIEDVMVVPPFYDSPYYGASWRGSWRFPRRHFEMSPPVFEPIPPPALEPIPPVTSSSPRLCIAHPAAGAAPPMVGSRGFVVPCPSRLFR